MANRLGISEASYEDLERYDPEIFMSLSARQVCSLAGLLSVSPRSLVARDDVAVPAKQVSMGELVQHIRSYMAANALSVAGFEDQVGWKVRATLEEPERGWDEWNLDALQDICGALNIEWLSVLPE